MLKDITLGQYFPGNTLVHRLDPRTKLLCVVFYIVALFCAKGIVGYGVIALVLAVSIYVSGVKLKDLRTGEESEIACDGLFISVGRKPATALVEGQLELDGSGYVVADETTATSIPGVYAVGDLRTKKLRQVVTAVADGAMAVHMAEEYLIR